MFKVKLGEAVALSREAVISGSPLIDKMSAPAIGVGGGGGGQTVLWSRPAPVGVERKPVGKVDITSDGSSGAGAARACHGAALTGGGAPIDGGAVKGGAVAGGAVFGQNGDEERGDRGTFAGSRGGALGGSGMPGGSAGAGGRPLTATGGA